MTTSTIVIEPNTNRFAINFSELYRFRELLFTLAERDLKVRYKQTVLGGLWAIIQPFTTMVVFSFFFGKIAQIPSEGVPYPVFSYAGLLLWTFFTNSMTSVGNSMVGNSGLISKVYFPRLIIPFSSTIVSFVDYSIAGIMLFVIMVYFKYPLSISIIFTPVIVIFTWFLATGIGLWLAALNVRFRDVRYIIPFFVQLLIFASPVIYPASVSGNYKWVIMLNPISGLIEAHRALILHNQPINFLMLGLSLAFTILIFISGLVYFKSVERKFADII